MNNMMLWVTLVCDALCIFAFSVTPYFTRKTELFGVSLPSAEIGRPELSAMRRSYLGVSLLAGAALIAINVVLFLVYSGEMAQVRIYMILIFVFIAAEFLVYLAFHRRMQAFKATQPWRTRGAADHGGASAQRFAAGPVAHGNDGSTLDGAAGFSDSRYGSLSGGSGQEKAEEPVLVVDTAPPVRDVIHPAWLLLYAAMGVFTLLWLWYLWPSLPDRIPVNMDAAGAVAEWADKSAGTFLMMLWPQWLMTGVFIFVYIIIIISKRQIDAANPHESREQGHRFRYRMSACIVFCGAALTAITGLLPIMMAQGSGGMVYAVVPIVLIFAVTGVMLVVMYRTGQGGSRIKVRDGEPGDGRKRMANTDDDRYWKLGVFYFNPSDPAVFVEKRFGIGWTNNFARPMTWLLVGVLAAVIVLSLVLTFTFA